MERARFIIIFFFLFLFSISLLPVLKAKDEATTRAVYIAEVEQPEGIQLEAFYLKILSAALGSMEAAKNSLIYSYQTVTCGFAAWLTQKQAYDVSNQPGVLVVLIDQEYRLFPGPAPGIPQPAGPS